MGVVGYDGIQFFLELHYLSRLNLYVRSLALYASKRLVYHHAAMWQCRAFSLFACYEEHGSHRGCHAGTYCSNIGGYELHSVVYSQSGSYRTAWRVDINRYISSRVAGVKI